MKSGASRAHYLKPTQSFINKAQSKFELMKQSALKTDQESIKAIVEELNEITVSNTDDESKNQYMKLDP